MEPSPQVLNQFTLPDVSAIALRNIDSYNFTTSQPENFAFHEMPYRFYLDSVDSQFVTFSIYFEIGDISGLDRKTAGLITSAWLDSPERHNGELLDLDEVKKRRKSNVLSIYMTSGGLDIMGFSVRCSIDKYLEAMQTVKDAMFKAELVRERIEPSLKRTLNSFSETKNSPYSILYGIYESMKYQSDYANNFVKRARFANATLQRLESDGDEFVAELNAFKNEMIRPSKAIVHLGTNVDLLVEKYGDEAINVWKNLFGSDAVYADPETLTQRVEKKNVWEFEKEVKDVRYAVAGQYYWQKYNNFIFHDILIGKQKLPYISDVKASESCYFRQESVIPQLSDHDYNHPDMLPLSIVTKLINKEIFTLVRGEGLAYGAYISVDVIGGKANIGLYR